MAVAARQISVIVDADSAPLQAAVGKAADSLQALGAELAKQSTAAVAQGREQISSNAAVADSYERTAGAVRGSVLSVVESIQTQKGAQVEAADGAVRSGQIQVDASARTAEAARVATGTIVTAANEQAAAQGRAARAAEASAGQQVASAGKATAAHEKTFTAATAGIAGVGKKVAVAGAAVGAASLFMASKFEAATLKLSTQAGASHKNLEQLRDGILNLAGPLGQTPEHLSEGLYHIVSSMDRMLPPAKRVNEELKIMEVAAKGAAVGGTSMEETSYALASAMNALHQNAGDAEKTMGQLNAIVGAGDMTMQDLLDALKSGLIPTAAQFGLSLQSVGAALAVMGDMGVRGAEAGTRLRMSIALLGAPSQQAAKMLTAIGMGAGEVHARTGAMTEALAKAHLTTVTLSEDMRKPNGLVVALRDLRTHLEQSGLSAEGASALLVRAFGGGRMSSTILTLSGNTDRLNTKFKQIGDEGDKFGQRWKETQRTLKHQADETVASLEVLGIRLGEKLAPAAKEVLSDVKGFAEWLVKGSDEAHVLEGTVGAIAATLAGAFAVNKIANWVKAVKEAAGALGKLTGLGGGSGRGGVASVAGGIMGSRGPVAPGSIENPIAVTGLGGVPGGEPIALVAGGAGAEAGADGAGVGGAAAVGAIGSIALAFKAFMSPPSRPISEARFEHYVNENKPIPHAYSPVVLTTTFGRGGVEVSRMPQFGGSPAGPSHPEAGAVGGPSTVPSPAAVAATKAQTKAEIDLAFANKKVSETQAEVNNAEREGRQHTPEFTKLTRELANAERERGKAVAELAKASATAAQAFEGERGHIEHTISTMEARIRSHPSAGAIHQVAINYAKLIGGIETEMAQGKVAVATGTEQINKLLEQEGRGLGVTIKVGAQTNLGNTPAPKGPGAAFGPGLPEGAEGMRVPGPVGPDDVPIVAPSGGVRGIVAGGELLVANRHTEDRVDRMLSMFGTSLGAEVAGEHTPHSAPRMAKGGSLPRMVAAANAISAHHYPYLWGGGHGGFTGPYDCSGAVSAVLHAGGLLSAPRVAGGFENYGLPGPGEVTLFVNDNSHVYMRMGGKYFGTSNANPGGGAGWFPGGPRPGFAERHVPPGLLGGMGVLKTPRWGGPGGAVGQIGKAVLRKETSAANKKLNQALASATAGAFGGGNPGDGGGGNPSANEKLGREMMTAAGFDPGQWPFLQKLWTRESGWDANSVNKSSGAYGIPQALGHGHPFNLGDARSQIAWGLNYIRGRYGSPASAWGHETAVGWYAKGGRIKAATGARIAAAKGKPKPSKATKHGAAKVKVPSFTGMVSRLAAIPQIQPALKVLSGVQERLEAQRAQETLLTGFESQPAQILAADMKYLSPTIQAGEVINPGMLVPQAERSRQVWLQTHAGTPDTDLQGELLSWIGGLDNHRLLTSGDVGIMSSYFPTSRVPLRAGYPMFAGQAALIEAQEGGEKMVRDEMGPLVGQMHQFGVERRERQLAAQRLQAREVQRYKSIQSALRTLAVKGAKSGLKAAEAHALHAELSADAKQTRSSYTSEIARERARKHPDKGLIRELEARKAEIKDPPADLASGAVAKARVSVARAELKAELPPIEDVLSNLGGSKTSAGTGGLVGRLAGEISKLQSGIGELKPKISEASSAVPTLESTLQGIREAATNQEESVPPVKPIGTSSETESALKGALEEQNRQLKENLAVSEAQFRVLHAVTKNIPRYDTGGPVVDDGLIFAHKGEHVVPAGGTLVSNGRAPNVKVDNHFHGVSGELIEMIDSRVSHPDNVKRVGQEMGRRVHLLR